MLELQLDPRLPLALREPFLREARRAGVALDDIESMSYDAAVVRDFLAAVRDGRTHAFLLTLDRGRLERRRHPPAHDARPGSSPRATLRP